MAHQPGPFLPRDLLEKGTKRPWTLVRRRFSTNFQLERSVIGAPANVWLIGKEVAATGWGRAAQCCIPTKSQVQGIERWSTR